MIEYVFDVAGKTITVQASSLKDAVEALEGTREFYGINVDGEHYGIAPINPIQIQKRDAVSQGGDRILSEDTYGEAANAALEILRELWDDEFFRNLDDLVRRAEIRTTINVDVRRTIEELEEWLAYV